MTEIVQFQVRLDEVTQEAFTWELWAAADEALSAFGSGQPTSVPEVVGRWARP
ncbi:hypothetical protein [Streptomyces sp. NPDC057617]|uniref:hypothetical protein n=1 Tax=Streptomyces sp. NPDC057617 TaxID=3346184 RepID=UPI0036A6F56B